MCYSIHNFKLLLFADDLKIYRSIRNVDNCIFCSLILTPCKIGVWKIILNFCNSVPITPKMIGVSFNYELYNNLLYIPSVLRSLSSQWLHVFSRFKTVVYDSLQYTFPFHCWQPLSSVGCTVLVRPKLSVCTCCLELFYRRVLLARKRLKKISSLMQ
jgi:hypothetical protein